MAYTFDQLKKKLQEGTVQHGSRVHALNLEAKIRSLYIWVNKDTCTGRRNHRSKIAVFIHSTEIYLKWRLNAWKSISFHSNKKELKCKSVLIWGSKACILPGSSVLPPGGQRYSAVIVFSVSVFGNADLPRLRSTKGILACRKGHDDELSGGNWFHNRQQSSWPPACCTRGTCGPFLCNLNWGQIILPFWHQWHWTNKTVYCLLRSLTLSFKNTTARPVVPWGISVCCRIAPLPLTLSFPHICSRKKALTGNSEVFFHKAVQTPCVDTSVVPE